MTAPASVVPPAAALPGVPRQPSHGQAGPDDFDAVLVGAVLQGAERESTIQDNKVQDDGAAAQERGVQDGAAQEKMVLEGVLHPGLQDEAHQSARLAVRTGQPEEAPRITEGALASTAPDMGWAHTPRGMPLQESLRRIAPFPAAAPGTLEAAMAAGSPDVAVSQMSAPPPGHSAVLAVPAAVQASAAGSAPSASRAAMASTATAHSAAVAGGAAVPTNETAAASPLQFGAHQAGPGGTRNYTELRSVAVTSLAPPVPVTAAPLPVTTAPAPVDAGLAPTTASAAAVPVDAGLSATTAAAAPSGAAPFTATAAVSSPSPPPVSTGPGAPAPANPHLHLVPQLSRPLFMLAAAPQGQHTMILRVAPEDLGPLTVRAHIDAAGIRIELFAPGDPGREAVRNVLPDLRRELSESGCGATLELSDRKGPADSGASGSKQSGYGPFDSEPGGGRREPGLQRNTTNERDESPTPAAGTRNTVLPAGTATTLDVLV